MAHKRTIKGKIISLKMQKTAVVEAMRLKLYPKYKTRFRTSRKFKAHVNDSSKYQVGDRVIIEETRPLSKEKRWIVKGLIKEKMSKS